MIKSKQMLTLALAALLITSSTSFAAVKPVPVSIFVNDAKLDTYDSEVKKDLPAMISNGRTLMPLKKTFEVFGLDVKWDSKNRVIETLTDKGIAIWIQIGNKNAKVDGKTVSLDVPAQIIDNRTYVPVAFIAKAVGNEAKWDSVNKLVRIYTDGSDALNLSAIPTGYNNKPNRVNNTIFFDSTAGKMISVTETELDFAGTIDLMVQMMNLQASDFVVTNAVSGSQIAVYEDVFSGMTRSQLVAEKNGRTFMIEVRGMNSQDATAFVKSLLK